MNCLILVLLLLCCQGGCTNGRSGCCNMDERDDGCPDKAPCRRDSDRGRDCDRDRGRDRDRDRDRNPDCGCRNESRMDSRSFIPYPGSTCGCEEPRNKGCDCDN